MPFASGIYAINIRIDEWRSGVIVGTTYREMVLDSNTIIGVNNINSENPIFTILPNPVHDVLHLIFRENVSVASTSIFNLEGPIHDAFFTGRTTHFSPAYFENPLS